MKNTIEEAETIPIPGKTFLHQKAVSSWGNTGTV
jgi:hypothetical protein